ncbi:MAG: nucleotidyltransferase family protein [Gemmatimonadota bacterium]|nr:nucleotidyltransferase family protein [Gemmatimonadota bacterium]
MSLSAASAGALIAALGVALPTPEQTLLLRACLCDGADARDAWKRWVETVGDPKAAMAGDRGSVKRLLPLLYFALRRGDADVDPALAPYLRLAYLREQMRSTTYLRICGDVLGALEQASVDAILLRGAALAATVYDDPALRHCHDIALLVAPDDVERAADALLGAGLERVTLHGEEGGMAALLRHETALPVELHTRLFSAALYELPLDELQGRSVEVRIGGATAHVLSPADALVHVCGHASYSESRASLRWIGDAWLLIDRNTDLDWDQVLQTTERSRLALPMLVALRYLTLELSARVPATLLARLEARARESTPIERDVALHGARLGAATDTGSLLREMPGGLAVRGRVAAWLLFPSRAYVSDVLQARGPMAQLACYASRPVDYLRRRWAAR